MTTLRDMIRDGLHRDRSKGQKGHHLWQFVANPGACQKCKEEDGDRMYGSQKPTRFPHAPGHDGEYNCGCHWEKKY